MRTVTPPAPGQRAAVWCKADGSQGANITSEQRAEPFSVGPSGSPRYRADLEWPPHIRRQEEWYRRGRYAFVSYIVGDRGVFCWGKPSQSRLRRARIPIPFVPSGHFPLTRGIGPHRGSQVPSPVIARRATPDVAIRSSSYLPPPLGEVPSAYTGRRGPAAFGRPQI